MDKDVYGLFSGDHSPEEILEYLNNAAFYELAEIDLVNDRIHVIYRENGKYVGTVTDAAYREIRSYAGNHFVYQEDREKYFALTDPDTLERRFAESRYPGILSAQYRIKTTKGTTRWVEQVLVYGERFGLASGIVRNYHFDIQLKKNRRLSLAFSEKGKRKRDNLTGLLVGDSFYTAAQAMLSVPLDGGQWSVLFISIEHLKLFREWYGKEVSDQLLVDLGNVLRREASETNGLAAHLWDDDFLLLCPYDEKRIRELYEKLHNEIKKLGISVGFLPAIGICLQEEEQTAPLTLADRAALAAASIRGNFRTRICMYRPEMGDRTREEYQLLSQVQKGFIKEEFDFVLQPQCLVTTGQILGAEALVRWNKEDGASIAPGTFIPVLEKYGFTSELDQFVWRQVCHWIRSWIDRGHRPIPISVNVSQTDILTFDVAGYLDSLIKEFRLPRDVLELEITESAYVSDMELVRNTVSRLRELGFRVLMDDFGSGYSSLNMLHTLGLDIVKLDAHFLHLDKNDLRGMQILESVIGMTKRLSLPVIVEGVETEEHVRFLSSLGCRYVQGYFFYRPMSVSDFEVLAADESKLDYGGFVFCGAQQIHSRDFLDETIYSDTILNNIIGAAAFYSWDGQRRIDVIRYNEQFAELVGDPRLDKRLTDILSYCPEKEKDVFLEMLRKAEADQVNGASGVIGVYRAGGSLGRFYLRLYYLEEQASGKVFYASMQEVTELLNLQTNLKLISHVLDESVFLLSPRRDGWNFQVVVNGLYPRLGLHRADLERELNDGSFSLHALPEERKALADVLGMAEGVPGALSFHFVLPSGELLPLRLNVTEADEEDSDASYVAVLSEERKAD